MLFKDFTITNLKGLIGIAMIDNYDNMPKNSKENVEEIYNKKMAMNMRIAMG